MRANTKYELNLSPNYSLDMRDVRRFKFEVSEVGELLNRLRVEGG